ncbi:NAD(P)-binding protein [Mycena belliarum]|uniref:NAD(P)-binding protein n=1 Tax=Mycena belliarum TaxID=1033014 RepID=A0AAD6XSY4_9AGAR|nr:NAD(P)-binding protein [Mycena belliae]
MPTITIFGATGSQGSAVLNAVLADGKYTPRAVSRSLESDASKALIAKGVEVVKANLFDVDSLKAALRGSEAVFGVTNFWDPEVFPADPKGKGEITQGKNLVDAAKAEGVKFFMWSSLPNATETSKGLYKHIYHVDNKAIIEDYLRASGVPHAVLLTGWFAENIYKLGALKKTETGYTFPMPMYKAEDTQSATWVSHDLGAAAVALLSNYTDPSKGILGSSFPVISMKFTYPQLAKAIAAAINKEVTFTSLPTSGLQEVDEMYEYQAKIGMYADTPVPNPALVALGVKFGTMEEFIKADVVPRFA